MRKFIWIVLFALSGCAGLEYALSPDGPLGYDEGVRLADRIGKAAHALQRSGDHSSSLLYTPKYGNDQPIHVEITPGDHPMVVVSVLRGQSGSGYALGRSAEVPRRLAVDKPQGPVEIGLARSGDVVQVISVR